MAIESIVKPFSGGLSKLRLLGRRRSKRGTAAAAADHAAAGEAVSSKTGEFRQVFRFLDANGDGKISADELAAFFASVGESVSREEAERIIGEFSGGGEIEGSGELGFEEFVRVVELRETEDDAAVLRRAFEVYEVEKGSGCITAEGLRRVFRRLGEVKSVKECEAMIRVFDLDGNGVLDFNEFYKMMS
ncbi:probable calcium-binding protein CML41 [Andrographis paniculata]|uniref:probable calcium-binding protein CML41 n=1 Tax=Andrographis paniculata TaxID=175694 RepID=UPI0021E7EA2D|nr:probable calcium-binding protein CML41 [Andrographis paniculata]